jgi:hypothetical protein
MSAKSEGLEGEGAEDEVCASCGIAAIDDVKLKQCACNLVKYCTVDCQKNHRSRHKKACKKRLAELHDGELFTQPDSSHMGECPLCCLPLPIDESRSIFMGCCSKFICKGCNYANKKREFDQGLEHRCAFCRHPSAKSQEEHCKNIMERVKKNDPVAMIQMGKNHYHEGDFGKAVEYYTKASELGGVSGHCCLGNMYYFGDGVEKDEKKAVYHWEQAAIGGHHVARASLADFEMENDRPKRAVKHYIINANLGDDPSLKCIKDLFIQGIVSKEEYAAALRAHQAAVDATKSSEREKQEELWLKWVDNNREKRLDRTK